MGAAAQLSGVIISLTEPRRLDTTHNCWHGPYDSFSRWRNLLAKAAGYTLKPVTYGAGHTFDKVDIDWRAIERENPGCYNGDWLVPPTDALTLLIAHSDCEGHLKAADCSRLADRLQTLLLFPSPRFLEFSISP